MENKPESPKRTVLAKSGPEGKITTWNDTGKQFDNGARRVLASQEDMTVIPQDGGESYKEPVERIHVSKASLTEAGQETLARELAGMPLRGDKLIHQTQTGNLIEASMHDVYEVDGVKYATLLDAEGNEHYAHLEHLEPGSQAEQREKFKEEMSEIGEEVLEAAGVDQPLNPYPEHSQQHIDWNTQQHALQQEASSAKDIIGDLKSGRPPLNPQPVPSFVDQAQPDVATEPVIPNLQEMMEAAAPETFDGVLAVLNESDKYRAVSYSNSLIRLGEIEGKQGMHNEENKLVMDIRASKQYMSPDLLAVANRAHTARMASRGLTARFI